MADDFLASTATAGRLAINESIVGNIEVPGDHDWLEVLLSAGTNYTFSADVNSGGNYTLRDSLLILRNGAGNAVASDDDHGGYLSSQFVFTPVTSGVYYLDASSFSNTATGTYRLNAVSTNAQAPFTSGNDTFIVPSTSPNGSWYGLEGNDRITGTNHGDIIYGGAGNDTLLPGTALSLSAFQGMVYRLYDAALDRFPDTAGFQPWVNVLQGGASLNSVASGFIQSTEFQTNYGSLNNNDFVNLLYINVLNRPADASAQSWVNLLNNGASRESVLVGFSESPENQAQTALASQGWSSTVLHNAEYSQVFRLYDATLSRAPDPTGFEGWVNALSSGSSLADIASGFTNSIEFTSTYGSLTNSQFVTLLYNNVLNRPPEAAGLNAWVNLLESGASRESVLLGFSESPEFKANTDALFKSYMRDGLDDWGQTYNAGSGENHVLGGRGSNTFVFDLDDGAAQTNVYGAQAWDTLQFNNFGYSGLQAITHMTQAHGDVTFADRGVTVIFHDTTIAALSQLNYDVLS
ncbi:hypothetical protein LNAOJCKE_4022 [Methylorubrum aminovorans]|uniref:DUF4214 domain-containing protein n=1 Tax=Methylorubrum aminovorans TaxID=269069 RepID=A0ABQ4UM04_9HYPH|nr:DUF4214 domain-containing protein [Methylorubrum aminovorans]GJE66800.1 hypothetical protein LNAOJCKE_4022 [Methylorubrum aminovorans]